MGLTWRVLTCPPREESDLDQIPHFIITGEEMMKIVLLFFLDFQGNSLGNKSCNSLYLNNNFMLAWFQVSNLANEYLDLLLDKVIKTNLVQGKFTQIETFALASNLFDSVVVLISDEDAPPPLDNGRTASLGHVPNCSQS